ncbi:hypothetical protein ACJX0J_027141, partial [Zea mays]
MCLASEVSVVSLIKYRLYLKNHMLLDLIVKALSGGTMNFLITFLIQRYTALLTKQMLYSFVVWTAQVDVLLITTNGLEVEVAYIRYNKGVAVQMTEKEACPYIGIELKAGRSRIKIYP